ncbi:type III-A CRISPR-associated protein Csm2 [Defluviitalea phaphyphila]|uniref:type III-A CRISPR-associated protein Csm2 n=1 Tax=Defluviitalea phaphyphila TaxID=1473580 RepID=UPI00073069C3|nr:type III-A CRISPR-associated protein Csm2 [Defluviitalea phaphyphila]
MQKIKNDQKKLDNSKNFDNSINKILNALSEKIKKEFTKEDILNKDIIDLVEEFAAALRDKKFISNSSIRNIFDSFKSIQLKMQRDFIRRLSEESFDKKVVEEEIFKKYYVYIKLMKGKTNYILQKKKKEDKSKDKGYELLRKFIETFIDNIKSKKEFDYFIDLFECVLGNLRYEE